MKIYVLIAKSFKDSKVARAFIDKDKADKFVNICNEYQKTHPQGGNLAGMVNGELAKRTETWREEHPLKDLEVTSGLICYYFEVQEVELE